MRMTKTIFNELCNDYAYLYVVRLYNDKESFYKIGITSKEDCTSRFKSFPYEYDIIKMYKHKDSGFIMDLESKLLSLEESYRPVKEFGGWSECTVDVAKALEFVDTLSWIKDLSEHALKASDKIPMMRSVQALVVEYNALLESEGVDSNFSANLKSFLTNNTQFTEWLESGVTPKNMNSLNNKTKISDLAYSLRLLERVESSNIKLPFKVGEMYPKSLIKKVFQDYYDAKQIKLKAKAIDIKKYYEVKATTDSNNDNCFKIIKKL